MRPSVSLRPGGWSRRARGVVTQGGDRLSEPSQTFLDPTYGSKTRARLEGRQFGTARRAGPYLGWTTGRCAAGPDQRAAFTLLEIVLASMAAALILLAIYGIFQHALRLRDSGDRRIHAARLRARAETAIRTDLQNALVSGGILAATFLRGQQRHRHQRSHDRRRGQFSWLLQVYDHDGPRLFCGPVRRRAAGGILYHPRSRRAARSRAARRVASWCAPSRATCSTPTMPPAAPRPATRARSRSSSGVQSFQVSFYDGANWQTSWQFTGLEHHRQRGRAHPDPDARQRFSDHQHPERRNRLARRRAR